MKKVYYSYLGYVLLLSLLLVCRYFDILTKSVVMMVYLIILMIEFTICFGGFDTKSKQQTNKKKTKQDDPILIKPLLIVSTPVLIFFIINYLYK